MTGEHSLHYASEAGQRVGNFLKDPAVKDAFEFLEKEYYDAFLDSKTPEERTDAWAKSRVLADFSRCMMAIIGAGERARDEITRAEARTSPTPV